MNVSDDLMAPDTVADPYAYFNRLRAVDPVHHNTQIGAFIVTRYDDVQAAFRDERLSADRITPYYQPKLSGPNREMLLPAYENLSKWMVFLDPPDHSRLRSLVVKAFTPRVIEALRQSIRDTVRELLDEAGQHEMDFIHAFAYPLPVIVVSDMFGMPREDRDKIKHWSDEIMLVVMGALDVQDRHERARRAFVDFEEYLRGRIAERRRTPREDLLSLLLAAEERGDALSEQEILSTCLMLLFAGHETTTNLLANALLGLLQHPAQLELLRREPNVLTPAIEEFLRYDGPAKAMWRIAKEDVELGGKMIPKGGRVLLVIAAAHRDPERFDAPDTFDLRREKNPHLGFGFGAHYCLGAPLARLETELAFTEILARYPRISLAESALEWHPTVLTRSLKTLRIAY